MFRCTSQLREGPKRILRRVLASGPLTRLWSPLARGDVTIFTLHRFSVPELGVTGQDVRMLRAALERLRSAGYELLRLDEAIDRLAGAETASRRAVVFTIDDGYEDVAAVADTFLAFDCAPTVFVTTGFVDGDCWQWWDQIEHVCLKTERRGVQADLGGRTLQLEFGAPHERAGLARTLWGLCKTVSDAEKWSFIDSFAQRAGVEIPGEAPERYRSLSWSTIRSLEARGFAFAPHGVTHPILPRVGDERAEWEIRVSWQTLRREVDEPLPIFAYPNGDFGDREIRLLERLGFSAAVSTTPRYATPERFDGTPTGRFQVPRFGCPRDPVRVQLIASGFYRVSSYLRGDTA